MRFSAVIARLQVTTSSRLAPHSKLRKSKKKKKGKKKYTFFGYLDFVGFEPIALRAAVVFGESVLNP